MTFAVILAALALTDPPKCGPMTEEERVAVVDNTDFGRARKEAVLTKEQEVSSVERQIEEAEAAPPDGKPGHKTRTDRRVRELKARLSKLRDELRALEAWTAPDLKWELGSIGRLPREEGHTAFIVSQVIDDDEMVIVERYTTMRQVVRNNLPMVVPDGPHDKRPFVVRGLKATGIVDEQWLDLPHLFRVCETMQGDNSQTLFVADYFQVPNVRTDGENPPKVLRK